MNFKQLEYFAAVADEGSISGAARELHVAQPPVSRQLALLEDELGVTLFLRTNKGVELTGPVPLPAQPADVSEPADHGGQRSGRGRRGPGPAQAGRYLL